MHASTRGHATPRLLRAIAWVGCLSKGEAEAAIRDYRGAMSGQYSADILVYGGGEAVSHWGGPKAIIERASNPYMRRTIARIYASHASEVAR